MNSLSRYGNKVQEADFLLFYLGWDARWGTDAYFGDYPCIDDAVMDFILAGDYKGIGFDVIGLDPIDDASLPRHKRLFENKDIVNIENLCNLGLCGDDLFWFSCFPLKIADSDGSPPDFCKPPKKQRKKLQVLDREQRTRMLQLAREAEREGVTPAELAAVRCMIEACAADLDASWQKA